MFISHPLIKENALELRAYQENIAKNAHAKNTLVVAPTALGKTVIAVMVALNFIEKFPEKKVLILAPTRPLAAQHAISFVNFLKIDEDKVNLFTGNVLPEKRKALWEDSIIVCATPHVINNDFALGRYSPRDVSLAVFDEAHRAVGGYPYSSVAKLLECRILALTASPGSDEQTINEVRKNLKIENLEVRDEADPDVASYVKGFEIEWKKVNLPEPYLVLRTLLSGLLRDRLKVLKNNGVIKSVRTDISKKELLGIGPLSSYLERTVSRANAPNSSKSLLTLSKNNEFKRIVAMSNKLRDKYDDPKLEMLIDIIKDVEKDCKIIVFTQYRDSAKEIVNELNSIIGVKAVRFVGQASKVKDPGLSQKEQLKILTQFKEGEYNILVATSVAEEGLDIPAVDLVVFYEPVASEIRSIQRRGRTGRSKIGRVVVLMASKTRDEGIYWSSVAKEKHMKKSLKDLKKSPEKPDLKKLSNWVH
jgi:Fanconi anemia group M protein